MALREINLVPSNILARRQLLRHFSFWAVCLVILLAPIFGFYVYQAGAIMARKRTVANTDDINKHLLRQIDAVKRIQKELNFLNRQQADLQSVVRHSDYSRILFKLADIVNAYTWFKTLRINKGNTPKDPIVLQASGYAATNVALGNFLNRLTSDPLFENVILKYAKEPPMEKSDANAEKLAKGVEFEIVCRILRG